MAEDTELAIVLRELRAHGIKPTQERTGGGHIAVQWCVEGKQPRHYVVPGTGSDFRGRLNARADVRRYLKADNVTLVEAHPRKPKTALVQALSVPTQIEPLPDSVAALRSEVADLSMLCMEMAEMVRQLAQRASEAVATNGHANGNGHGKQRVKMNTVKVANFLSRRKWQHIETIAEKSGLTPELAARKLYYLIRQEAVERRGDCYRLHPNRSN